MNKNGENINENNSKEVIVSNNSIKDKFLKHKILIAIISLTVVLILIINGTVGERLRAKKFLIKMTANSYVLL